MKEHGQENEFELKRILHTELIELMDAGGTSAYWTADWICGEHPDLAVQYGFERIEALADEMLKSELKDLSSRFQKMFAEFNELYFAGRLSLYTVKVMYDAGWVPVRGLAGIEEPISGVISYRDKLIRIRAREPESSMVETLLHEMAHAATDGYHGFKWTLEMIRLRDAGAPIDPQHTWAVGGRVWRTIEKAGVGRLVAEGDIDHREPSVSEAERLFDLGLSPEEFHLLTALRMIGPNRSLDQIGAVAAARSLNERHTNGKRRGRTTN